MDEPEFERRFAPMLGVDDEASSSGMFAGTAPDARMLGAVRPPRDARHQHRADLQLLGRGATRGS